MPPQPLRRAFVATPQVRAVPRPKTDTGCSLHGDHKMGAVLYGPSGVGKSVLCAEFDNVGYIYEPQETGIEELIKFKQCKKPERLWKVNSWSEGKKSLLNTILEAGTSDINMIVIDAMTGLEQLCFMHHCHKYFADDWSDKGFYSYSKGPKNAAKRDWPDLIMAMQQVREAGKHVILIGHCTTKQFVNPDGPDYDQYAPYLDKEIWGITHRWASAIFFYQFEVGLQDKKGSIKAKADNAKERRVIYTQHAASYHAKNRYGLDPIIQAGNSGREACLALCNAYNKALPAA